MELPIKTVDQMNKQYVEEVIAHFGGNKRAAGHALGISNKTLYSWLYKWGLNTEYVKRYQLRGQDQPYKTKQSDYE